MMPRRTVFWQLLLVLLLAAPLVLAAGYVLDKHRWAQDRLAELEPRHARLQGLVAEQPRIEAQLAQLQAWLAGRVHGAEVPAAQVGSQAQQQIRDLLGKPGLTVASLQLLPARTVDGLELLPVSVRVEGTLETLSQALASVLAVQPQLLIESANLQTVGAVRPGTAPVVQAQITFLALRVLP